MIRVTDLAIPQDDCYPTLQDAMTALVARYPEAVFSDIDFEHEPTIWVWPTNDASKYADEREAVASIRQADTDSPVAQALELALRYGQIDGAHHKTWVIDQMVRALLQTPEAYTAWVVEACAGDDGPDSYDWDVGIPP